MSSLPRLARSTGDAVDAPLGLVVQLPKGGAFTANLCPRLAALVLRRFSGGTGRIVRKRSFGTASCPMQGASLWCFQMLRKWRNSAGSDAVFVAKLQHEPESL